MPLNSDIRPIQELPVFYANIKPTHPKRASSAALAKNGITFESLVLEAPKPEKVEDMLVEWFERLELPAYAIIAQILFCVCGPAMRALLRHATWPPVPWPNRKVLFLKRPPEAILVRYRRCLSRRRDGCDGPWPRSHLIEPGRALGDSSRLKPASFWSACKPVSTGIYHQIARCLTTKLVKLALGLELFFG